MREENEQCEGPLGASFILGIVLWPLEKGGSVCVCVCVCARACECAGGKGLGGDSGTTAKSSWTSWSDFMVLVTWWSSGDPWPLGQLGDGEYVEILRGNGRGSQHRKSGLYSPSPSRFFLGKLCILKTKSLLKIKTKIFYSPVKFKGNESGC